MSSDTKKIFVLDTNVLMHDPTALFRFEEHDIILPMVVLEELDRGKKGLTEVARNVRQVSRYLDEMVEKVNGEIDKGIPLPATEEMAAGRLYFHLDPVQHPMPHGMHADTADNTLLGITLDLSRRYPDKDVALVTKDINLRIKARALSIIAEDYTSDQALEDTDLLYTGADEFDSNFWETQGKIESWTSEEGRAGYRLSDIDPRDWYPNQFIHVSGDQPF